jgi:hypothetical protein
MSEIKITWEYDKVPSQEAVEQTQKELRELLENGLKCPSNLWSHTVILGEDMEGPGVTVIGMADETFSCMYHEKLNWVSMKEEDNGSDDIH